MINKVIVTNHLGESIELELKFPEKSGFFIREDGIVGLTPPKANINLTENSNIDRATYNSAKANARNIVFSLGFLEKPTIEATRLKSYKYFPIKRRIRIVVETDARLCETYGYVESSEPSIFSSAQGSNISVLCPDAYLYSLVRQVTSFSGTVPLFQFPFSNEAVFADGLWSYQPNIQFGAIEINPRKSILYEGDVPVGIMVYLTITGSPGDVEIINITGRTAMLIDDSRVYMLTGGYMQPGDEIIISTIRGSKFIYLERNGEFFNILNAIGRNVSWFQLDRGDNVFAYTAVNGIASLQFRLENQIAYEGV
jgi:hypothetical protein